MSSAERNRKHALIATVLLALVLVGAGLTFYLYSEWKVASSALTELSWKSEIMQSTLQQVNATAPKVTVTLTFTPTPPEKHVPPDTITFLTGYVTATNLTDLLYPATMVVNFTVTHLASGNATAEYSYIPYQTVYLTRGISFVQVPFGVFPLEIHGKPGDQILICVTARVLIYWTYVNAVMVDQKVDGIFTVYVGG